MSEQRPDRPSAQPPGGPGNGGGNGKKNGGGGGGRTPLGPGRMPVGRGFFGWFLFIALAVMLIMLLNKSGNSYATVPLSEFVSRLETDKVKTLTIDGDKITGEFITTEIIAGDKVGKFQTPLPAGAANTWELTKWVLDNRHNAQVNVENSPNWLLQVILPLVPWLLIFGFIWFFVFRQLRRQKGQGAEPMRVYVVNLPGGENAPPAEAP